MLARATPSLSEQDLIYMPASVQLELFRARQLSPVEVLEAQIARHEAVNSKVNCTTYTFFQKGEEGGQGVGSALDARHRTSP